MVMVVIGVPAFRIIEMISTVNHSTKWLIKLYRNKHSILILIAFHINRVNFRLTVG